MARLAGARDEITATSAQLWVGQNAPHEHQLVRTKCTPILLYGIGCFQLGKADRHSLDFTFNRLCMKLFRTGSIAAVKDCQSCFAIDLPSYVLKRRHDKFILRHSSTVNVFLPILQQFVILN